MARGVPFLASRTGANHELSETGAGFLMPASASGGMWLDRVQHLFDDRNELQRCGECGKSAVLNRYNYEVQFQQVLEAFDGYARK